MSYKVGDRVMVIEESMLGDRLKMYPSSYFCQYEDEVTGIGFNHQMMTLCGTYVTIKAVRNDGSYSIEENSFTWIDNFFIKDSLATSRIDEFLFTRKTIVDNLGKEIERITKLVDESEQLQLKLLDRIKAVDDMIADILTKDKE